MEKCIVDILLAAAVVLSALIAAKKGFFLTLLSIVSAGAALIGSKILSTPVAQFAYDSFVRAPVLSKVQAMLPEVLNGADPQTVIDGVLEQLPAGVAALVKNYGFLDSVTTAAGDAASFFNIENLEINYIKPFCLSVLSVLATVVCFYVLFVVLRMLAKLLDFVIYRNKPQPVNRLLGAALGVVRAAIPVFVFTFLLNFAADYNFNPTLTAAVDNSKICAWADSFTQDMIAEFSPSAQTVTE